MLNDWASIPKPTPQHQLPCSLSPTDRDKERNQRRQKTSAHNRSHVSDSHWPVWPIFSGWPGLRVGDGCQKVGPGGEDDIGGDGA